MSRCKFGATMLVSWTIHTAIPVFGTGRSDDHAMFRATFYISDHPVQMRKHAHIQGQQTKHLE